VAGIMVRVTARKGGDNSFSFDNTGGPRKEVSDADGRFEVADAPSGKATLSGFPIDFSDSDYDFVFKPIEVVGTGVSEVGDVPAIKRRVKRGEPAGELGLSFVQMPPDLEPGQYELKVSRVRPGSPAAAVGIAAGDVVVAVDGHDVRGERVAMGWTLMNVAVGAKVRLGLARGVTVEVTAGPPP
jgi:PDZ domain